MAHSMLIACTILFSLSLLCSWLNAKATQRAYTQTLLTSHFQTHAQRIAQAAPKALAGNAEALTQMRESLRDNQRRWQLLSTGGEYMDIGLLPATAAQQPLILALEKAWMSTSKAAALIVSDKPKLSSVAETLRNMRKLTPEMEELAAAIYTRQMQTAASPREIAASSHLLTLLIRLSRSAVEVAATGTTPETAFLLGQDANSVANLIDGFLHGSAKLQLPASKDPVTLERLNQLQTRFATYQGQVSQILTAFPQLIEAKFAAELIATDNATLAQILGKLHQSYSTQQAQANWAFWAMLASGFMALVLAWRSRGGANL
jgi:twitching motility protein PilJ